MFFTSSLKWLEEPFLKAPVGVLSSMMPWSVIILSFTHHRFVLNSFQEVQNSIMLLYLKQNKKIEGTFVRSRFEPTHAKPCSSPDAHHFVGSQRMWWMFLFHFCWAVHYPAEKAWRNRSVEQRFSDNLIWKFNHIVQCLGNDLGMPINVTDMLFYLNDCEPKRHGSWTAFAAFSPYFPELS